jgi:hypothetical protein
MTDMNRIVKYCAEEVTRQGDTPMHVYYMLNAWGWAIRCVARPDPSVGAAPPSRSATDLWAQTGGWFRT